MSDKPANDIFDFVFLDDKSRPFRVRTCGDSVMLYYWHPGKIWVSLRILTEQSEVWHMQSIALPNEKAQLYEAGVPFLNQNNERNNMCAEVEMPKYQSHKKIWALKIKSIELDSDKANEEDRETDGSAMIIPEEDGYAPFKVDHEYMRKHNPKVGGYYVQYKDGYASWSPAEAFEEGYSLIK